MMKFLLMAMSLILATPVIAEETVGEKVGKTAREVQEGVTRGVENLGEMIKETSKDVAKGAKKAAKEVAEEAKEFAGDVKEGYEKGGSTSN